MVTLVVATTTDPASIGPASALLAMPGWQPGLSFEGITSFVNEDVRLLQHDKGIVEEDHLDKRWEQASSEVVHELIFLSKHTAVSNRPALTIHPIGVPHLRQGDVPLQGGKPGWAAPPSPRMAPWLKLLKTIAESRGLIPEFEITLEATHHGPETNTPTMFVEIELKVEDEEEGEGERESKSNRPAKPKPKSKSSVVVAVAIEVQLQQHQSKSKSKSIARRKRKRRLRLGFI
ncbi:hypothetical protein TEA_015552 [Camellia sinensis var. sinensis]|uniref:D-aminoacyl-tRNA deacylase n=1 Tax=Camellia sinensis var. sinensis TaxID=542762 RepID=A0A4S4CXS8_CAMSN|nr:hypothetical protein TEA_015552 [Camellia sinensis var. sinensis]